MRITIKPSYGKTFILEVGASDTIRSVKEKAQEETGISADTMRLIISGKMLQDEKALSDYNVQEEALIYMLFILRGGCL